MCDPLSIGLTIASTAATVGGTALNARAQSQAIKAQNKANQDAQALSNMMRRQEQQRQSDFTQEQQALFEAAALRADPARLREDTAAEGAEMLADLSSETRAETAPIVPGTGQSGLSKLIAGGIHREVQDAKRQLSGLSLLSGGGTARADMANDLARFGGEQNRIGSLRAGSLAASNLEQNIAPAVVTPSQSPLGDLLIGLGQAGTSYAGYAAGGGGVQGRTTFRGRPATWRPN